MNGPTLTSRFSPKTRCAAFVVFVLAACGEAKTISLLPGPVTKPPTSKPDAESDARRSGCKSDSECPTPNSICDLNDDICVQCIADSDCSTGTCNLGTRTCTGCKSALDCTAAAPVCDLDVHTCVQCESSAQCPAGQVCAFESHRCAPACQTNSDCAGSGRPLCAVASRVCVECTTDSDCAALGRPPRCNLFNGTCVSCLSDADCAPGRCQLLEHLCVECLTGSDCEGGTCSHYKCGP